MFMFHHITITHFWRLSKMWPVLAMFNPCIKKISLYFVFILICKWITSVERRLVDFWVTLYWYNSFFSWRVNWVIVHHIVLPACQCIRVRMSVRPWVVVVFLTQITTSIKYGNKQKRLDVWDFSWALVFL